MADNFDKFNPIYMMAFSGARGNIKQIRQLAGMRGLMADPKGETIDRPIKANFREGLSVLEYFISTHGARKGMADTALRTADSGYLTRRLVDVSQDVIVHDLDCGSTEGYDYPVRDSEGKLNVSLVGRCINQDVKDSKGKVILKRDEYIRNIKHVAELEEAGVTAVNVRTVMTCHSEHGVCQKCYGWDLAASRPVNIGTAVGVIAAQSIGEPGTQLTMRTFHTGGVAGEDITMGLPRVEELFEARNPKGAAVLAEIDGTFQIKKEGDKQRITIHNKKGDIQEVTVSDKTNLFEGITNGCEVKCGQQITKGSVNLQDLLRLTDPHTTLGYIVQEVQKVYVGQGVDINDKHIEVIARQMLRRCVIEEPGDTDLVPGNQISHYELNKLVKQCEDEGKEPPVAVPLLLGLTKAATSTDSWVSAASFQETTRNLTEAAIAGKVDHLIGLKENVCIGKPIPAGTGLKRYNEFGIKYHGVPEEMTEGDVLPEEFAPDALKEQETMIPKEETLSLDEEGFIHMGGDAQSAANADYFQRANISSEDAKLYLYDDLGVSQRWANKFGEASIETVGDLVGHTEKDLMKIEGIGVKAMDELKQGLSSRNLLHVIEDKLEATDDEIKNLLNMVFSPDQDILVDDDSKIDVDGFELVDKDEGSDAK